MSDLKLVPPSTCVTCLGIKVDTVHKLYLSLTTKCKILKHCVKHGQIRKLIPNNNFNPYLDHFCILIFIKTCVGSTHSLINIMGSHTLIINNQIIQCIWMLLWPVWGKYLATWSIPSPYSLLINISILHSSKC